MRRVTGHEGAKMRHRPELAWRLFFDIACISGSFIKTISLAMPVLLGL
jgi:hypothetical protein